MTLVLLMLLLNGRANMLIKGRLANALPSTTSASVDAIMVH